MNLTTTLNYASKKSNLSQSSGQCKHMETNIHDNIMRTDHLKTLYTLRNSITLLWWVHTEDIYSKMIL